MSALSPATIASVAVLSARAAREFLDALSDVEVATVTEKKVREHASRAALASSPGASAAALQDVVRAAIAEEVRAFLERGVVAPDAAAAAAPAAAAAAAAAAKEQPPRPPTRAGRGANKEHDEGRRGAAAARGGKRAPRKASTASFIVSDDADEDEDGDYEDEEADDDIDDDDDSENDEEGESSDDDESKAPTAARPAPKKKAKRAAEATGRGGGRPAATAATSVGESPAVFRVDDENDRAPPRVPTAAERASHAAAADAARPSSSIPAVLRLPLGDRRFASVSRLGGTRRLDVREWYLPKGETEEEGLKPGLKGISLGAAAVGVLRSQVAVLDEALKARRDFSFALEEKSSEASKNEGGGGAGGSSQGGSGGGRAPTKKVAATSLWQSVWRVDLREHFLTGGGEWRPTKKGISLSPAAWAKLVEALPELERAVVGGGGGGGGGGAALKRE